MPKYAIGLNLCFCVGSGEERESKVKTSQFENGYASSRVRNLVAFNKNRNDAARGVMSFDGLNCVMTQ